LSDSSAPGGLHEAVDAFDQAIIGDPAVEPAQDARPMPPDGPGGFDHRRLSAVGGPEVPPLEERFGRIARHHLIEVLEDRPRVPDPADLPGALSAPITQRRRNLPQEVVFLDDPQPPPADDRRHQDRQAHWDSILRWQATHTANGILEGINSLV